MLNPATFLELVREGSPLTFEYTFRRWNLP
jgi:hypothetical protein